MALKIDGAPQISNKAPPSGNGQAPARRPCCAFSGVAGPQSSILGSPGFANQREQRCPWKHCTWCTWRRAATAPLGSNGFRFNTHPKLVAAGCARPRRYQRWRDPLERRAKPFQFFGLRLCQLGGPARCVPGGSGRSTICGPLGHWTEATAEAASFLRHPTWQTNSKIPNSRWY